MSVYALFRNHTGTAWFDDFSAHALEGPTISTASRSRSRSSPRGRDTLRVAAKDGLALNLDAQGAIAAVDLGNQKVSGEAGGFYLRDVAADGPLMAMRGTTQPRKAGGYNIDCIAKQQHIVFSAAVYPDGDALAVDGEMTDKTNSDRAVTIYLALPVQAADWLWGEDIRHSEPLEPGREFTNQVRVNVGATGGLSLYHSAASQAHRAAWGIASQIDWPSVYRIFYNSPTHQFVIAWTSPSQAKRPPGLAQCRFRCKLFRLPAGPPKGRSARRRNASTSSTHTSLSGAPLPKESGCVYGPRHRAKTPRTSVSPITRATTA